MSDRLKLWMFCAAAAVLMSIGGVIGYLLHDDAPRVEVISHMPAVPQQDGSLIAERAPDSSPPPAPHQIPKAAIEERRIAASVKPFRDDCPPVRMDLSLVQVDGGRRVIVSSPDGTVESAVDIPIAAALLLPTPRRWAAGGAYDVSRDRYGAWLERDIGRFRFGADLHQSTDRQGVEAWVRIGLNF